MRTLQWVGIVLLAVLAVQAATPEWVFEGETARLPDSEATATITVLDAASVSAVEVSLVELESRSESIGEAFGLNLKTTPPQGLAIIVR